MSCDALAAAPVLSVLRAIPAGEEPVARGTCEADVEEGDMRL